MGETIVVWTEHSEYFADSLTKHFLSKNILVERKRFKGGERYFRLLDEDRMAFFGKNVVLVASVVTDEDLDEVERLGTALAKSGARRVIYVIPFEAYTTMERSVKPNEIVTAKIVARRLSKIPQGDLRNCFLFMDLHTAGFIHYFEDNCLVFEFYAQEILAGVIQDLKLTNFMFGSADLGRPKWVEAFAKKFGTDIAFIRKSRSFENTEVLGVIGDVSGKTVVIYDDMTRSAGSLAKAAKAYIDHGAVDVYAVVSHLALDTCDVVKVLEESQLKMIISTNSHPMSQHLHVHFLHKFIIKDVAHLFVEAIQRLL